MTVEINLLLALRDDNYRKEVSRELEGYSVFDLRNDAADEIARLTDERDSLRDAPFRLGDGVDYLTGEIQSRGLRHADLEDAIGSPQRVCDVLARRRALSIRMIRRLVFDHGFDAAKLLTESK